MKTFNVAYIFLIALFLLNISREIKTANFSDREIIEINNLFNIGSLSELKVFFENLSKDQKEELLTIVIARDNPRFVYTLLSWGVNVNAQVGNKNTALIIASNNLLSGMVNILLNSKGIDLYKMNSQGYDAWNAIFLNVYKKDNNIKKMENIVKYFIDKKYNIDNLIKIVEGSEVQETALNIAAKFCFTSIAKLLIDAKADVNKLNTLGDSALHEAINAGCNDIVKFLLTANADVNAKSGTFGTPLHIAIAKLNKNIIRMLIKIPQLDYSIKNNAGLTPLDLAKLTKENSEIVKIIESDIERRRKSVKEMIVKTNMTIDDLSGLIAEYVM